MQDLCRGVRVPIPGMHAAVPQAGLATVYVQNLRCPQCKMIGENLAGALLAVMLKDAIPGEQAKASPGIGASVHMHNLLASCLSLLTSQASTKRVSASPPVRVPQITSSLHSSNTHS